MTELARLDTLAAYWKSCEELKHAPEYERIAEIFAEGVRELGEERDKFAAGVRGLVVDLCKLSDAFGLPSVGSSDPIDADKILEAIIALKDKLAAAESRLAEMEGMREALKDAKALRNLGFNECHADSCKGGWDESGVHVSEYRARADELEARIDAARAAREQGNA